MSESGETDAAYDMATWMLTDAAGGMPGFQRYLLAHAYDLPDNPDAVRIALAARWPALSDAERDTAFRVAIRVLRATQHECEETAAWREALAGGGGRG